jgi:16S rRNA (uracil1498-N3)-methyltransferase
VNYFFQPDILKDITQLDREESNHCIRVLRKKRGDLIHILDGKGGKYIGKITTEDPSAVAFQVVGKDPVPAHNFFIHIAITPTKNMERIEWFIEKSVEIGIDRISFIQCRNSERKSVKQNRLERKSISAMKQAGNLFLPEIRGIIPFEEFLESDFGNTLRYIGHAQEGSSNPLIKRAEPHHNYVVLIGPEGDFTPDEIRKAGDNGFLPVSLGSSRLRTETAGLVACTILNLINSQAG